LRSQILDDQTALVGVDEQVAFKAMRASSSSVALLRFFVA
jgi:hypothetical protein